ncbi:protein FAR1-RELATED SEQUENCE 5-like [Mercurialis annua]|uniref:protein FAR1-RELATED SEQUENCE 5-like n=1 Tax=Mercurialis annua TaxID=3986 RepID=UPI00215FED42|nr:protein FAR1-RELATED SEQUENCE 5-like [Mercurialis annua]
MAKICNPQQIIEVMFLDGMSTDYSVLSFHINESAELGAKVKVLRCNNSRRQMGLPFDLNDPFSPSDDTFCYETDISTEHKEEDHDADESPMEPQLTRAYCERPFSTVKDAENFYNTYAKIVGFSIRCQDQRIKNKIPKMRLWVCSCHGVRRKRSINRARAERRITRTNCGALFQIKWMPLLNLFHASKFVHVHNHTLALPAHVQFLRSHRHIKEEQATKINILLGAGIPKGQIVDYILSINGESDAIGFTRKDVYNYQVPSQVPKGSTNDAEATVAFITGLAVKDPGIYCRYSANEDEKLCRLFFSDSISRAEFKNFGDVVVCDATYKTNTFRMPLVLFTGLDNNHLNIVFAFAIINCEDAETYNWVFRTFVDCMGGTAPKAILTDADKAMQVALRESMRLTRHGWCAWHICRNLTSVPGKDQKFRDEFAALMQKKCTPDIFRSLWNRFKKKNMYCPRNYHGLC